jgi:integrase
MRVSGGSVVFNKQKATWNFLWWEAGRRRSKLLGTIRELPTSADAERAAKPYRRLLHRPVTIIPTVNELVVRYRSEAMPERQTTRRGYEVWIKNHILPKWGESKITELQPYPVELWLKSLDLSPKSRFHIRGVLSILWSLAMRRGDVPVGENPMNLVRVKGIKKRRHRVLTATEFHSLLEALGGDASMRTLVIVAMSFGLRISECLGLKWKDVNWLTRLLTIERGVVKQIVDDVKTEESARSMALAPELIEVLLRWKQASQFTGMEDWIFASPRELGRQPLSYTWVWDSLGKAGKAAGIGHVSSHLFRHTYRSWLDSVGTPVGVQQKMMRHADIRTTMNVYGDALTDDMREAGQKMAKMALGRA